MMNIRFGTDGDYTSHVDSSGGYEWWYFDVKQQDFACTVIFLGECRCHPIISNHYLMDCQIIIADFLFLSIKMIKKLLDAFIIPIN